MRMGSLFCFVMAVLAAMVAINNLMNSPNAPKETGDLVGYAVGAFLPAMVLLIAGLWLMSRQKK